MHRNKTIKFCVVATLIVGIAMLLGVVGSRKDPDRSNQSSSTSHAASTPAMAADQESLRVGPLLSIRADSIDRGTLPVNQLVVREIEFRNTSDRVVVVEVSSVSCHCVTATVTPSRVEPGETSLLRIEANDWSGRAGLIYHAAFIHVTNAEGFGKPEATLTVPIQWRIYQEVKLRGSLLDLRPVVGSDFHAVIYAHSPSNITTAIRAATTTIDGLSIGRPSKVDVDAWEIPISLKPFSTTDSVYGEILFERFSESEPPLFMSVHIRPIEAMQSTPSSIIRSFAIDDSIDEIISIKFTRAECMSNHDRIFVSLRDASAQDVRLTSTNINADGVIGVHITSDGGAIAASKNELVVHDVHGNLLASVPIVLFRTPEP